MNKENALSTWLQSLLESWSWNKLSETEKRMYLVRVTALKLRGSFEKRYQALQLDYHDYLTAYCGYSPIGWRE